MEVESEGMIRFKLKEYTEEKKWQSTPVLLPGKSHGQRSLGGYSPWGRKESDTTEQFHFTSLHEETTGYIQNVGRE